MSTDKSPTPSLPDLKTVKNLSHLSLEQHLLIQETLRQSEAKEWIKRFKKKVKEEGQSEAYAWWQRTLSDLVKKRGQTAVDDLRRRMNDEVGKD